jgi:prepilin-type N-terminal cleavage/methylation domain-containing protein
MKHSNLSTITYSSRGFTLIEVLVALSVFALSIAGLAQLRVAGFEHISVTGQVQQATYFADTHFNRLSHDAVVLGQQNGEYRPADTQYPYPWHLSLEPLSEDVLMPTSASLSTKVKALKADLTVFIDNGSRQLHFHTLVLTTPPADTADKPAGNVVLNQP